MRLQREAMYTQHGALMEAQNDLIEMSREIQRVTGNEDFKEGMKSLGGGALSVAKWLGGKTLTAFSAGITAAGTQLQRSFDDNKTHISKVLSSSSKGDSRELKLTAAQVSALTSKGDPDTFEKDLDVYMAHLEGFYKHGKEVQEFLDEQLVAVRKLKDAKHTDDVFKVIETVEKLTYPAFKLESHKGSTYTSALLPGGTTWIFSDPDGTAPKYIMSGDTPAGEGATLTFSKAEVSSILNKLGKVNDLHQRVKQSYDGYLSFVKSWSEMVKTVDENLGKLEYKVSKSALKAAGNLLEGNTGALAFYSGFTPRVVGRTDRYVHGVLGVFA